MIDNMRNDEINVFRSVANNYISTFAYVVAELGVGTDNEQVRWIALEPDKEYETSEQIARTKYGKVSKASQLYEFDTDNKYVIEINRTIWEAMNQQEQVAFAFYLLARIYATTGKEGETKFGLVTEYTAQRMLEANMPGVVLPNAENIAARILGGQNASANPF